MALGKELFKLTVPGQIKHQYGKYRKGRSEDKKSEKFLKGVKSGKTGLPETVKDIEKMHQEAGKGANKFYGDIQNRAVTEFNQETVPSLLTQYGQGSKSSSALNQALGAAAGNMQQRIAADFAALKQNYATNLVNTAQYGQAQNLQNRLMANQGQNAQGQFWSKAAPIAGLAIGTAYGNPALGTQIGTAAGQVMN